MTTETDRIQRHVLLKAPRSRVWRALTDSREFGSWFGMKLDGSFTAGKTVRGTIAPTTVDPAVADKQKPYTGQAFDIAIDRIEPERVFSFRWHPFAIDTTKDYSAEPMTLVVFELEEKSAGVLLTVTESGFDKIPIERRAKAFAANEGGWAAQMVLIEKYLAQAAGR